MWAWGMFAPHHTPSPQPRCEQEWKRLRGNSRPFGPVGSSADDFSQTCSRCLRPAKDIQQISEVHRELSGDERNSGSPTTATRLLELLVLVLGLPPLLRVTTASTAIFATVASAIFYCFYCCYYDRCHSSHSRTCAA